MSLIKKYSDVNWAEWLDTPEEETFNLWLQKRVSKKKGNYPSPRAMNMIRAHVNQLFSVHSISADDAFFAAEEAAWDSIKVSWVLNAIARDIEAYSVPAPINIGNVTSISSATKSTRDMGLSEELSREWAE